MKRLSLCLLLPAWLCLSPARTEDVFPVDLDAVLKLAGARNLTIEAARLRYQQALAEQSKANEWWLPALQTGLTTHYLTGAAMNADGKIFTGVDRNNLWSGVGIRAEIDFNQGLFGALAARQQADAAFHFSIAEKNQALLKSVEAYFDLQAGQLKTAFLEALVEQAHTFTQQVDLQAEAGLRYQSEALLAQSNVGHLKIALLKARAEQQQTTTALVNLLHLDPGVKLVSSDAALVPLTLEAAPSQAEGYSERPEFKGLNAELEALQTRRKTANEGLLLPKLTVGAQNGVFGAYDGPTRNTSEVNAALLWTLPLGRLTYQGDLKQWDARIALQKNKLAQFQNRYRQEVTRAETGLQAAGEQVAIGKEALRQAAEALEQSLARERLGTVKPFEVFQSQQFYLEAQSDYLQAVADYNKAQFALKVAQGEILVAD